jgi:hypothetical protein
VDAQFLTLTIGVLAVFAVIAAIAAAAAMKTLSGRLGRSKAERLRMSLSGARPAPVRTPASARTLPEPRPAPRLEAYLFAADAPKRLSVPVLTTRGRILEIGLPLHLRWTGAGDLADLSIETQLPNEITYGPSLERMIAEGLPCALAGGHATYASGPALTTVRDRAARLQPGVETVVFIPIAVKHGQAGAFPVSIAVSSAGAPTARLDHVLELFAAKGPCAAAAWLCVPDEAARTRDERLPLDRITSARFARVEA